MKRNTPPACGECLCFRAYQPGGKYGECRTVRHMVTRDRPACDRITKRIPRAQRDDGQQLDMSGMSLNDRVRANLPNVARRIFEQMEREAGQNQRKEVDGE